MGARVQQHVLDRHLAHKRLVGARGAPLGGALGVPLALSFEFNSVYTGGKREARPQRATPLPPLPFPMVQTDRGGQVTYHGPGQLVCYFVWDLFNWSGLNGRCFVSMLEKSLVSAVEGEGVSGVCTTKDTGVWVRTLTSKGGALRENAEHSASPDGRRSEEQQLPVATELRKICSLGLNIKRNITSHGISMNVAPDLSHLNNPNLVICGLEGKRQTSLAELGFSTSIEHMALQTVQHVALRMGNHMGESMAVETRVIESSKVEDIIAEIDRQALSVG